MKNCSASSQAVNDAVAIRCVRILDKNTLRTYEPVRCKVRLCLNRLRLFKHRSNPNYALADILNEVGDIIADVSLNKDQFSYLQRSLGFKIEKEVSK